MAATFDLWEAAQGTPVDVATPRLITVSVQRLPVALTEADLKTLRAAFYLFALALTPAASDARH